MAGWNGSSGASAPKTPPKKAVKASAIRGIIALVAVLAIGATAYLFVAKKEPKPADKGTPKSSKIQEVVPRIVERVEPVQVVTNEEAVAIPAKPRNVRKARGAGSGRVMTLMDGTVVTNSHKAVFKRDFEHALMVAMRPGGMSAGLMNAVRTRYSDTQIMAMLKEMTVVQPGDSSDVVAIKKQVQALKEEILIEVSNGRSLTSVLNQLQTQSAKENKIRVDAMKLRAEAAKTGDKDLVDFVTEKKNKELSELGLQKLPGIISHKHESED